MKPEFLPSARAKVARLTINQRILLSSALILGISLVIALLNIFVLSTIKADFTSYKQSSRDTAFMLHMDREIADLQRLLQAFTLVGATTSTESLKTLQSDLINEINQSLEQHTLHDTVDLEPLKKMKATMESFAEKIESIEVQKSYREDFVTAKLGSFLDMQEEKVDELFAQRKRDNNADFINDLWEVKHKLATARSLSSLYFSKHEYQIKNDVLNNLRDAAAILHNNHAARKNPPLEISIAETQQAISDTTAIFHQAVQADRNYLFLVNVVIAGESAELSNLSEQLKNTHINEQNVLFEDTSLRISWNQKLYFGLSLLGALLTFAIAFSTGNYISTLLQSITHTFSRLTQGENITDIPGAERSDEIGRLAQAANVFRSTNARTQKLLEQTEQFAAELKERKIAFEHAASKAQEASVAKSQFLANMSHELRTPMNAVMGLLSLMRKTQLTERQSDYVNKADGAARTLLSLLNDILDLSKAEAGKIELNPEPFYLDTLLRDISVILSTYLTNKAVELRFHVPQELPRYFRGDALRLQQILINLGGNAIKFTERGSVIIAISSEAVDETSTRICFSISDTGIGIAPENQEKIFSGFTQAEASTTRRFGGTGLGLAISKHLVNLMGGELALESLEGVGSRFYFSIDLPRINEAEIVRLIESQKADDSAKRLQALQGLRLLVVEDNLNNQQIALELLEDEGACVVIANHGREAVDMLAYQLQSTNTAGFDAILMDLQMPVMDGITATRLIRDELGLIDLPIVAMTANAMASDRETCLAARMNEHVGKPFDIAQLAEILLAVTGFGNSTKPHAASPNTIAPGENAPLSPANIIIDLDNAIKRMGGRAKLYWKMAPEFCATLSALPSELRGHLDNSDLIALKRSVHSLKGLAGTMGATELATEAARVDKLLVSELSAREIKTLIDAFCEFSSAFLPHIEYLIAANNNTPH